MIQPLILTHSLAGGVGYEVGGESMSCPYNKSRWRKTSWMRRLNTTSGRQRPASGSSRLPSSSRWEAKTRAAFTQRRHEGIEMMLARYRRPVVIVSPADPPASSSQWDSYRARTVWYVTEDQVATHTRKTLSAIISHGRGPSFRRRWMRWRGSQ